jgi:L-threonylcarbamoyladenylate synthase
MDCCSLQTRVGPELGPAISLLKAGDVVAIPTETVYGLAGNAYSEEAVRRIYAIKQRPLHNPLIVHVSDVSKISEIAADIPELAWTLLERFSPGPLTLLLPKRPVVSDLVTAGLPRVAVRIPAHPLALELLRNLDFPLTAPSANPFGYISPTHPEHVLNQLGGKIAYILDGGICDKGIESTVVGFEDGKPVIYRLGAVSEEEIRNVAKTAMVRDKENAAPPGPGMLAHHYSPHTRLIFAEDSGELVQALRPEDIGILAFQERWPDIPRENQIVLSPAGNLDEAAHKLYGALHALDALNLRLIVAEKLPDHGMGRAMNDRLRRAAAKP